MNKEVRPVGRGGSNRHDGEHVKACEESSEEMEHMLSVLILAPVS